MTTFQMVRYVPSDNGQIQICSFGSGNMTTLVGRIHLSDDANKSVIDAG